MTKINEINVITQSITYFNKIIHLKYHLKLKHF